MRENYRKSILPGGIRLVTEKIPTVRSVALGVWVNVGGRDETDSNQGISHFLEHMIFKGTEKRTSLDIAREIEAVGGHLNAFTSAELTCFYAHLLDENIAIAIDVLADILSNSLFRDAEIEKEKSVVSEEIKHLEDTPDELILEYFIRHLYPGHSLGQPILGTVDTVNTFSSKDLISLIQDRYTADRVVIAAAGNLNHEEILKLVESVFSFSEPNGGILRSPVPPVAAGRKSFTRAINQAHICVGVRAFPYYDPRKYPFFVMNTVLGGGMSSRLFQSIRETFGYAYSVNTFTEALSDTGVFGVYVGTDRNRIDDVVGLVMQELERIRREKLDDELLARIKTQLKGNLMLGLESTSSRMSRLGKMEVYVNDFISLDDIVNKINQVTSEQVLEVAEELLKPENLLTVIFTPSEEL